MNWRNEKVLVTGGGGFLGRAIIKQLAELNCASIRTLGRQAQNELKKAGVDVLQGDLRDPKTVLRACENRTLVFHVAAKAGFWGKRRDYHGINVIGTTNVVDACLKTQIGRLVHTSSPSVAYPPTHNIENMDESAPYPLEFLAHYPQSKAEAEDFVLAANSPDLKTVALRPHLIWGPGDPHLLPRLIKKASQGRLMIVGDGTSMVDLTYVDNAAHAHIKAAEAVSDDPAKVAGKSYFISDCAPVRLWDWINQLLKDCGVAPVSRSLSYKKAKTLGAIMEVVFTLAPFLGEPPMTRFVAGQLAFSHYFNISAAKNDFGYAPIISPEEAMSKTLDDLRSRVI